MSAERAASGSSPTGAPVQIIATREQMNALKAKGWRVVGTHGGGSYVMEAPRG